MKLAGPKAPLGDLITTLEHLVGKGEMVAARHVCAAPQGDYGFIAPSETW